MDNFVIVTDSSADLPSEYIKEHGIFTMSLLYTIDGETYNSDDEEAAKTFYDKVRAGSMPTTSQVNPENAGIAIKKALEVSKNVLCISFSSGLSGTYNSIRIAAEDIMDDNKDANIIVVDSLAASMGEGLLVHKAVMMKESGSTLEETAKWIEDNKNHLVHIFTVSDLFHLYRGGRVKKAAAIVGSIINLKPILVVDNEGHLNNVMTVRGRNKSLRTMISMMEEKMGSYKDMNDIVFISHCDAKEDAETVALEIKEKFGIENILINTIGPTIGAHSGPDTVAIFFMGEEK